MFLGGKKQTSGIKWVKTLSKTDIHWSSKLKVHVILFKLETVFSLKALFLTLRVVTEFHNVIVVFHTWEKILCAHKKVLLNV